jgi:putative DNA primase/helicase
VEGAELLNEIRSLFNAHLVLPEHADIALSLWVLFTYAHHLAESCPLVLITSPEKRCGKTETVRVLLRLVNRPEPSSSITPAALFRVIEKHRPTLLIDEGETILRENEALRGLLNCGFTRDMAYKHVVAGDEHEPRKFSTWCPKVLAMIGLPPDTILDRCIVVPMQRKSTDTKLEPLRHRDKFPQLKSMAVRWVVDNEEELRCIPERPTGLDDRAALKWEGLLAIADAAGGQWPYLARKAAVVLSNAAEDESIRVQLLGDIRAVLKSKGDPDAVWSEDLCTALHDREDRPWSEYGRSRKPISKVQLARLLKPFDIKPRTIRIQEKTAKGYDRGALTMVFDKYLTPMQEAG